MGIKRRKKRVVERGEDLCLRLNVGEFRRSQGIAVDNFESKVGVVVVAEATKEDAAEVAGSDEAEEL